MEIESASNMITVLDGISVQSSVCAQNIGDTIEIDAIADMVLGGSNYGSGEDMVMEWAYLGLTFLFGEGAEQP